MILSDGDFNGWNWGDTWELAHPVDSVGVGHPAGSLRLSWDGTPEPGSTVCFSVPNPHPGAIALLAGGAGSPQSPPRVLRPPVLCETGYLHPIPAFLLSSRGHPAVFSLPVPPHPLLAGAVFIHPPGLRLSGRELPRRDRRSPGPHRRAVSQVP